MSNSPQTELQHHPDSIFKLNEVPFSTYGSWNSIKIPLDSDELMFCNHHGEHKNLFPLRVIKNNTIISPVIKAEPHLLTLLDGENFIEICFETPNNLRIRGKGLGLKIGERELMYECGVNLFAINKPFERRYQVQFIKGSGQLNQLVPTQPVYPKTLEVLTDNSGEWEIAIDKYKSTWVQPQRVSFDDSVSNAKMFFSNFLKKMPLVRKCDEKANIIANYINWATAVEPCGLVKRPSLLMSKFKMDKIWSWDHAFNAMALASGHPKLSMDQMLTMVDHQDEFGCYPDSFKDSSITYNFSKPPVHGWAFSEMLKSFSKQPSDDVFNTMYHSLSAQANWWMTHRVLEGKRLPYYLHGNDSGWDNSTMFKKGVPLEAPDLSALLITQMEHLSEMAILLNKKDESSSWKERSDQLYKNLMAELWQKDHFVAKLGVTDKLIESKSLVPWLPIMLGKRLPLDVREFLAAGIKNHLTEWGLATEHVDSEFYNDDGYWRGPIWAPSTFIAITGLDRSGYSELADEIAERFCRLGNKSGFPENYNALTGEALKCPAYTWTSSVFLLLANRLYENENRT